MISKRSLLLALAVALITAAPAALAGPVSIPAGIDLWHTPGNGTTYTDFAAEPIPADFFCAGSAAFAGKIAFRGVPVSADKALGTTDTIVERLDDAVFNGNREASTRIQVRALEFTSISPIETACGRFKANVSLAGEQPITTMRIVQDHEHGGHYLAPIHVNIRVRFEPVKAAANENLELYRELRFQANPNAQWTDFAPKRSVVAPGFIRIDTNGDRATDTYLPGTSSNFAAGWRFTPSRSFQALDDTIDPEPTYHCDSPGCTHNHTTTPPYPDEEPVLTNN